MALSAPDSNRWPRRWVSGQLRVWEQEETAVTTHFDLYKSGRLDSNRPTFMGIGKQIRLPAPLKAERLSGED